MAPSFGEPTLGSHRQEAAGNMLLAATDHRCSSDYPLENLSNHESATSIIQEVVQANRELKLCLVELSKYGLLGPQ